MIMQRLFISTLILGFFIASIYTGYYIKEFYKSPTQEIYQNPPQDPEYRLALIVPELGNPLAFEVKLGVGVEATKHGVSVITNTAQKASVDQMVKQMEIAIASKVHGIITLGIDHPDFNRVINKATTKGIPVITIAVDSPNSLRKTYVGTDHFEAGRLLGSEVAQAIQGKGVIGVIMGNKNSSEQQLRFQGFKEVMTRFPQIEIVEMSSEREGRIQASENTNELLNSYPYIDTFVGITSEDGAGIVRSINNRARIQDYRIYTFGDTPEVLSYIQNGMIKATVSQNPQHMGEKSVQLILQWLKGETLPLEPQYNTPIFIKKKEQGDAS